MESGFYLSFTFRYEQGNTVQYLYTHHFHIKPRRDF